MSNHYTYPFDPTGQAATNKITGEQQILSPPTWTDFYFIIPKAAPFFADGFKMWHQPNGGPIRELTVGVDFHFTHRFADATVGTQKAVYGSITFLDKNLTGVVSLQYQTVGGLWVIDEQKALEILSDTKLNPRVTTWEQVAGLPVAFPPIDHEHNTEDLVGMSEVVTAIETIANALLDDGEGGPGLAHINNKNNPHEVTKTQVGLGNVQNYGIASQAEAIAGTSNERYMTPLRVKQFIDASGATAAGDHINDLNNPHQVSKTQIGLGNVQDYGIATSNDAIQATSNDLYMTPLRTRELVDNRVGNTLNAHTTDMNNPHNTTKEQVGLSNVQNYGIASQAEAIAGTSNEKYMTPLRVMEAINSKVSGTVDGHVMDFGNPHQVSKAQVGLGNVDNFATATKEEAEEGERNDRFMTPLRVKEFFEVHFGSAVTDHADRTDNPHSVTKEQVGLSAVENYPIASQAEAEGGSANNRYMTPLRTNQLIEKKLGDAVSGHAERTDNPHNVTKDQVGLGSVQNFGIANTAAATAGTADNLYMTPLKVRQAIDNRVGTLIDAHADRVDNPHNVTAAQIGTYTSTQINNLLDGKLDVNGIATDSERVGGLTFSQIVEAASSSVGDAYARRITVPSPEDGVKYIRLVGMGGLDPLEEPGTPTLPGSYEPELGSGGEIIRKPDLVFLLTGAENDFNSPGTIHLVRVSRKPYGDVEVINVNGAPFDGEIGYTYGETGSYHIWLKTPDKRTTTTVTFLSEIGEYVTSQWEFEDEPNGIVYIPEKTLISTAGVGGTFESTFQQYNLNNLTDGGVFAADTTSTNTPIAGHAFIVTVRKGMGGGSDRLVQEAVCVTGPTNHGRRFENVNTGGSWNGWREVPILSENGALHLAAGAVNAPIIAKRGNTVTGIWFPADNQVGIATNGVNRVTLTDTEVQIGSSVDLRIGKAITFQDTAARDVTRTNLNINNVSNYAVASQAEATAGALNDRYMTPLRVKEAITSQVGNALTSHTSNTNNPHSVTKAQVGLGSVENYPIASQAEATAGTASNRYMTPQRTRNAITAITDPMQTQIDTIVSYLTSAFDEGADGL